MCGFCGVLSHRHENETELQSTVAAMSHTLAHRGPDRSSAWVDASAGIALGHERLAVLDLSPCGDQPMHSASGRYVIAYNGEIYNHEVLRRELASRGATFHGTSDTEVLLSAFEHWGVAE